MRFLEYLAERIISTKPYKYTFKAGNKYETFHGLESKTNSILFILNEPPKEWIKAPDAGSIYRVIITLKSSVGNLKYGHQGPDNLGIVKLEFPREVNIVYAKPGVFGPVIDMSEIWLIDGKEIHSWADKLKYLLSLNPKFKIIVDYSERKSVESFPPAIRKFINVYIAMGANRFGPGDEGYSGYKKDLESIKFDQVAKYYKDNIGSFPAPPKKVYRGISVAGWNDHNNKEITNLLKNLGTTFDKIKTGHTFSYKHPYKYPISCSTSVSVALDFISYSYHKASANKIKKALGVVLEFSPAIDDIIFDLRGSQSDHPAQSEVVLRPNKIYKVKVVRVQKILNGKIIK